MTCQFLQTLTLASMIAPIDEATFRAEYFERQPLVVHRNTPDFYDGLFSLADFDAAVTHAPAAVKTADALKDKMGNYQIDTAAGVESLLAEMRAGGTVILDAMHRLNPNLGQLCAKLNQQLGHQFQTNLYLTPANGQGFSAHWDNHDVFILQVMGSKNWKIEKDRRAFPTRDVHMGKDGRELRGELYEFTLEQGDIIYIPRGFVHAADCGDSASLHITLGLTAISMHDMLNAAIKMAGLNDNRFRAALPFGYHRNADNTAIVKQLRNLLRDIVEPAFLAGVLNQYFDERVSHYGLDVTGQLLDFFQPTPLTLDETVGPRPANITRVTPAEGTVRVNVGTRTIAFPDLFAPALAFALATPSFRIADLPGDIEDEERLAFIERLVEEGLVVRGK
jgi:ribosomal protein L16 Arg81 hydroxylase